MKNKLLRIVPLAVALAAGTGPLVAADTGVKADLQALVGKIRSRLAAGESIRQVVEID